jgi:hypothetical protein
MQTPATGFWKLRHLAIGLGVVLLVVLMLRACGSDEEKQQARHDDNMPRQAIVVQIPSSQWPAQPAPVQPPAPQQPGYGYIPQPMAQPPQPSVADGSNPWAVQQAPRGYDYGQSGNAQWGQPQPQRAPQYQYVPPPVSSRYRPLGEDNSTRIEPRPAPPPVQNYRPAAPYDRLSGSSFGEGQPGYPYYGGAYPGYYGQGAYGVPASPYVPVYPGVVPGAGWPGVW